MADGPSPLEQTVLRPVSERTAVDREVSTREGLSPSDKSLPVRQNIVRVWGHTPELQRLGEAVLSDNDQTMREAFDRAVTDIRRYYGLVVETIKDKRMLKLTNNPDNKATLRGNKLFMAQSAIGDPYQAVAELAHEIGAYRLIQIYGSKGEIPGGFPPAVDDDPHTTAATHYLDELVLSNGVTDCLRPIWNLK